MLLTYLSVKLPVERVIFHVKHNHPFIIQNYFDKPSEQWVVSVLVNYLKQKLPFWLSIRIH